MTIEVEPQEIQSTYNEVIVVLDSTNKTKKKFNFVIDININGVYSSRLKVQPNPSGYGIANLSKHLESAISSKLPNLNSGEIFNQITESYAEYDVKLYEEYLAEYIFTSVTDNGGKCQYNFSSSHNFTLGESINIEGDTTSLFDGFQTITAIPTPTTVVTSKDYIFVPSAIGAARLSSGSTSLFESSTGFTGTKYVLNNVLNFIDVPNWDYSEYDLTLATQRKMFTNLPLQYYSRIDDRITANIRHKDNYIAHYLKVVSNNGTYYFENQHAVSSATKEFLSVGIGAGDITNASLASGAPNDALPIFDDNTTSYTVQTVTSDYITPTSEERTFEIDRSCTQHENIKLIYLNRGGSYSSYNFAGANNKKVSVKKTNYQQNYGEYNSTLNSYGWTSYDKGTTRIKTDVKEVLTINSTWLPEVVGDLITELIASPQVYMLDSNGLLRAVEIKTSSLSIKKKAVKKLISYSLDLEYSVNNTNQR